MAEEEKQPAPKKRHLNVRVDEELYEEALERSRTYGGLSAVVRAMLRAFARGERNFDIEDLKEAHRRAPKQPRKRK